MLKKLLLGILVISISTVFLFAEGKETKKILFYRNPMNPAITSPVPMKDSMGMDYVPAYAEEAKPAKGIYISPESQKLLGIKTARAQEKRITSTVNASGVVSYDPELYLAQVEYLQALKLYTTGVTPDAQSKQLIEASKQKLVLAGMSISEIDELVQQGSAQQSLYLPTSGGSVWIYFNVYEQDMNLLKPGQNISIESTSAPGHVFKGVLKGLSPVVDPDTRSTKARAEIDNSQGLLKPGMFVSVEAEIILGKILVVPSQAVLNTGARSIVFVANGPERFVAKEIKAGRQFGDYTEIVSGLKSGEKIVAEGSFYVDSESKLKPN